MITIRSKVVEILPNYDYVHINKLTKKYMGIENIHFVEKVKKELFSK